MTFLISFSLVLNVTAKVAQLERQAFEDAVAFAVVIVALAGLAICAGWSASRLARSFEGQLQFEEVAEPAVFALDLHRDGVTPLGTES
jgi:hypothetical protein